MFVAEYVQKNGSLRIDAMLNSCAVPSDCTWYTGHRHRCAMAPTYFYHSGTPMNAAN